MKKPDTANTAAELLAASKLVAVALSANPGRPDLLIEELDAPAVRRFVDTFSTAQDTGAQGRT